MAGIGLAARTFSADVDIIEPTPIVLGRMERCVPAGVRLAAIILRLVSRSIGAKTRQYVVSSLGFVSPGVVLAKALCNGTPPCRNPRRRRGRLQPADGGQRSRHAGRP